MMITTIAIMMMRMIMIVFMMVIMMHMMMRRMIMIVFMVVIMMHIMMMRMIMIVFMMMMRINSGVSSDDNCGDCDLDDDTCDDNGGSGDEGSNDDHDSNNDDGDSYRLLLNTVSKPCHSWLKHKPSTIPCHLFKFCLYYTAICSTIDGPLPCFCFFL